MAQPELTSGESLSEQDDQRPEQPVATPADGGDASAQVRLERLYLKDSSFESPNSPGVFREQWQPEIELEINNRSHKVAEDRYEVILTATVKARQAGERTAFIVEIQQAAVFHMTGLDDQVTHRVLGTVCPNTLFPYVREALDSLIVRGGFPPLQLAPVNFDAAYEEALKQRDEPQIKH